MSYQDVWLGVQPSSGKEWKWMEIGVLDFTAKQEVKRPHVRHHQKGLGERNLMISEVEPNIVRLQSLIGIKEYRMGLGLTSCCPKTFVVN